MIRWLTYRWHAWRFRRETKGYHLSRALGMDDLTLRCYASHRSELAPQLRRIYAAECRRRGLEFPDA